MGFDLTNQNNDEIKEGLTTDQNNYSNFTNKYDDDNVTTTPVSKPVEETGSLSIETPNVVKEETTTTRPRTERSPRIKCPNCGSADIKYVTREKEADKNWGVICLMFIIFWPVALYLALKKDKKTYQVKQCQDCGKEF